MKAPRPVLTLILTIGLLAVPMVTPAQVRRIGVLEVGSAADASARMESFRQGLREVGLGEGQHLKIDWRFAEGQGAMLERLATELVGLNPDVLVTPSGDGVRAFRNVTTAIPIVMAGADPDVRFYTPQNLARPVGNTTGVISMARDGEGKRMELLRDVLPAVSRVGILRDYTQIPYREGRMAKSQSERWGFTFIGIVVGGPEDFDAALAGLLAERVGALSLENTPMLYAHRRRLADLAVKHRLAWIAADRDYAEAGCLMSFGANGAELVRRAATYVDRILKGAKPAELPIEQPSKFELVVNLRTAKRLRLTIPALVLARADEKLE